MSSNTTTAPVDRPRDTTITGTSPLRATVLFWLAALVAITLPWAGQASLADLIRAFWTFDPADYATVLAHFSWAPQVTMAILVGAGLGLAGAVTQQILGNPLASPSTLGVAAGCQLGLTLATLYAPGLLAISADLPAVAGGLLAIGLVVALTGRLGFSPVSVILAGLVVTFSLGAVNMAFLLIRGEWLGNLFIWGAGSLVQNQWQGVADLWPRLLLLGGLMIALMRPLRLLQLGDTSARALGARVAGVRALALVLVVVLTATVVSRVGVIAFVGLAAPVLARLFGGRTLGQRLFWSPLLGGGLLLLADGLAQLATDLGPGSLVPAGTTMALIGGPVILLALQSLRNTRQLPGQSASPGGMATGRRPVRWVAGGLALLLMATVILAMAWGPGLSGWHWTSPAEWPEAWHWRGPRLLAAAVAGALLGLAGTLIQRMTGNPMASPEMLGISGGAALAMVTVVLLGVDTDRATQLLVATAGAAGALALLLTLARRHRFAGNQLLLGGLALYVFMDAGLRLVMTAGGVAASRLLSWMYGATWLVTATEALTLLGLALAAAVALLAVLRPLALLPLGETTATALGLPVARARLGLLLLAALLTAAATVVVGPLSFVGLIAPHLARVLGQQTVGRQLLTAALVGAVLMALADYLSRTLMFPTQLPAGLLAALLGGGYFLWGLTRHGRA